MDDSSVLLGRLVGLWLLALPTLYFLIRAAGPGPRSRRLANLALFFGLAAFVMPEMVLGQPTGDRSGLLLTSGLVRISFGIAGLALGLAAWITRRDGGVSVARPMIGAGFSLLHLMVGAALVLFSSWSQPSEPWVYQSSDGAYRLTLPSQHWRQAPTTGGLGVVAFVRPAPRMQASVLVVRKGQTETDFAQAVEAVRTQAGNNPHLRNQAKFREGTNAAGNRYHFFSGMDSGPSGKSVFVGHSVTWCPANQTVIEVIFEGLPAMISQEGKAAEMELIEKSAETICRSVE